MDAFSGYHQILMEANSSKKTAFAGPYGRTYRYKVMPFGLVNAATVYTVMIYDMQDNWDYKAVVTFELRVNENNNTTTIIDEIFIFVTSFQNGLDYLKAILIIARLHCLTWKLKKCFFFPVRVEFVGHDLTQQGNLPADSKSTLLRSWPTPKTIRDISSFLGFSNFYARYIPYFEQRISTLRRLIREHNYTHEITADGWTPESGAEFHDIRDSILSQPLLLQRISGSKRIYIGTDFSKIGMGFWTAQPGDDPDSIKAMKEEDGGGPANSTSPLAASASSPAASDAAHAYPTRNSSTPGSERAKALQYGV
jgi:hypothetical protein